MHVEVLAHFNTLERRVLEDAMLALGILFSDTEKLGAEPDVVVRVRARRATRETAHALPSLRDAQAAFRGILQEGARLDRLIWARNTLAALQQAVEERRQLSFWLPPAADSARSGRPRSPTPLRRQSAWLRDGAPCLQRRRGPPAPGFDYRASSDRTKPAAGYERRRG